MKPSIPLPFPAVSSLLFGLVLALLAPAAGALEQVALQLKWTHAFQFAGYYMAQEKGYFREAGLDVDIREAGPETNVVNEVADGRAEYGVGTSSLLLDYRNGRPVVVLAAIFQHSPLVLIAAKNGEIRNPGDLAGQRVMFEKHSEELLAYLRREQLDMTRIIQVPHRFDPQALIRGEVAAMSAYEISEPYILEQAGFRYRTFSPRSVGIDFYGDNLFTSRAEIEHNPARVAAFRAASLRGWQYALDHIDETIELILQRYPGHVDRAYLQFEADRMLPLVHDDLVGIGYMHEGRWRHIADTYVELGMLPRDFSLGGFIYHDDANPDYRRLYRVLGTALLALAVTGGFALYSSRLNRRLQRSQRQLARRSNELQLQSRILDALTVDAPLDDVLRQLIDGIESSNHGLKCSILLLDENGQRFCRSVAPRLPDFYSQALVGLNIGDGVGSCGTAAFRGERVVVSDILEHPYWQPYRNIMLRTPLRSCWSQPFKDNTGRVIGTFAIYQDVVATPDAEQIEQIENYARLAALAVERARARQALRESEASFRLITENSTDVIWTLELPELSFSYVSPSVQRLRGWTAEEIMAHPVAAALTPESQKKVEAALADSLQRIAAGDAEGRHARLEVEQPCKDGSVIPTEVVTTILLDEAGRPKRILGITRDISERRRTEKALAEHRENLEHMVASRTEALRIAKESAEAASRVKSLFLSNISHELRTPMNAILGLSEVLRRRVEDPKNREILERQKESAQRLLTLIDDLIEIAHIGAKQLVLRREPMMLGELLRGVIERGQPAAQAKGLRVDYLPAPELETLALLGDAPRIEQILDNLLDNAIKFTETGTVKIVTSHTALADEKHEIRMIISDTGVGIPADDQARIFALFEQGDGSSTRKYGGTGLGLALCRQLAEAMGGRIGVDSQLGQGSSFQVTLTLDAA